MRASVALLALTTLGAPLAAQPLPVDIVWTVSGGRGLLTFTPDGTGLLTSRGANTLERLRTSDGTRSWLATGASVQDIAVINGGTEVVSAHGYWACAQFTCTENDPGLRVWSAGTGAFLRGTTVVSRWAIASTEGDWLVVSTFPTAHAGRTGLWNADAMGFEHDLLGGVPTALAISRDRALVASDVGAGNYDFIVLTDAETGAEVRRLAQNYACQNGPPCGGSITSVVFSPDGALVATATMGSSIRRPAVNVWRVSDGALLHSFETAFVTEGVQMSVKSWVDFAPDSRHLVVAVNHQTSAITAGRFYVYDLETGERVREYADDWLHFSDFDVAPDGRTFAYAYTIGDPAVPYTRLAHLDLPLVTANEPGAPVETLALTAAPNPSSAGATLSVALSAPGDLRVAAYDLLGREVALLHAGALPAGRHAFALAAGALPPGVYVVRATGSAGTASRRVTITP